MGVCRAQRSTDDAGLRSRRDLRQSVRRQPPHAPREGRRAAQDARPSRARLRVWRVGRRDALSAGEPRAGVMADVESSQPEEPPADLPSAADELARAVPTRAPVFDFDDAHKLRLQEAAVQERETQAKQADDDRTMRKEIAERVFKAISIQVVIADVAFLIYGFWNGWDIPGSTISAWLGAVVVQVIAVGLVIARSLFPPDKRAA